MASASSHCPFRHISFLQSESRFQSAESGYFGTPQFLKRSTSELIIYQNSVTTYIRKGCRQVAALPDIGDFFWEKDPTPILDMVDMPIQLKNLSHKELKQLAGEIRSEISFVMSKNRRPFRASLAVVELTVALHHVFHAPMDKILWDDGEQTYAHKILTGRRSLMHTLKRKDGLSGFTSRAESEYDAFGAGHGCNSISAGLGMAVARDINGKKNRIVTVISNWTTMAGQVYEAMSNAGYLDSNMIVILNDSRHSLHPKLSEGPKMTINPISSTLSKIQSSRSFRRFREAAKVIQDVDLQRLPVRFAISSAGLAGSEGPIHSGVFDITFMACLPNMIVMAPSDEDELIDMVATAACVNDRPICFRYPRVAIMGNNGLLHSGMPLEIGKGEMLVEGKHVALLGYGVMVQNCLKAQSLLAGLGIQVTVASARFCKPLDIELIRRLCQEHEFLITVEEGTVGGFGSHVSQFMALDGLLDGRVKWRPILLPDNYIEQATPREQLEIAGLTGHHIAATTLSLLGRHREAFLLMR
ncbi:hypothetical protein C4D60_Mb05t11550 [Musa balbisiana]|uniref:1-deoxy-D-xylulose-5-phosphate synthase n=1 Tax=Musa balbisiana TaxID=52838 RepID=A0A4S8JVE7_MUSBA|nr:hypothetical protein C4D60_Mb05t11550 [Musa balbisiana]